MNGGPMGALEKAKMVSVNGAVLPLMLNPTSLTISRGTTWKPAAAHGRPSSSSLGPLGGVVAAAASMVPGGGGEKPGLSQSSFGGSTPATLNMTVLIDAALISTEDVTPWVKILESWTRMPLDAESPPLVVFSWGMLVFTGYVKSAQITYKLVGPGGNLLRAQAAIVLQEEVLPLPAQNPSSGSLPGRARVVGDGDSLQSVATAEYGDPTRWRAVASANAIDDPLRLRVGTTLLIPADPRDA
ncbi:MAG: hypothetical protein WCB85_09990 [Candidatus Dormiibacterota bacterium]